MEQTDWTSNPHCPFDRAPMDYEERGGLDLWRCSECGAVVLRPADASVGAWGDELHVYATRDL